VITVDNGIASVEGVAELKRLGIATLITDHHLPGDETARCRRHRQPQPARLRFPEQGAGRRRRDVLRDAGAARRTAPARRLRRRSRNRTSPPCSTSWRWARWPTWCRWTATTASWWPRAWRASAAAACRPGIAALLPSPGASRRAPPAFDLGFALGPRLNAAGRLADMSLGIECLITDDAARAMNIAQQLDAINRERRNIEADMREDAELLLATLDPGSRASLTLFDPGWHQGVIGILAGRVKEKLHRPTFAFARAATPAS
jgi:single-stranded-DNA-specific exonuclease